MACENQSPLLSKLNTDGRIDDRLTANLLRCWTSAMELVRQLAPNEARGSRAWEPLLDFWRANGAIHYNRRCAAVQPLFSHANERREEREVNKLAPRHAVVLAATPPSGTRAGAAIPLTLRPAHRKGSTAGATCRTARRQPKGSIRGSTAIWSPAPCARRARHQTCPHTVTLVASLSSLFAESVKQCGITPRRC
eukprot:scaffold21729_cov85-Phaeocystis_antarctica.AAC.5